ncbi:hypothetical protein LguiA_023503 [Lonicera macranthoides]
MLEKISRATTFQFKPFSNSSISGSKTGIQSCCNKKCENPARPTWFNIYGRIIIQESGYG